MDASSDGDGEAPLCAPLRSEAANPRHAPGPRYTAYVTRFTTHRPRSPNQAPSRPNPARPLWPILPAILQPLRWAGTRLPQPLQRGSAAPGPRIRPVSPRLKATRRAARPTAAAPPAEPGSRPSGANLHGIHIRTRHHNWPAMAAVPPTRARLAPSSVVIEHITCIGNSPSGHVQWVAGSGRGSARISDEGSGEPARPLGRSTMVRCPCCHEAKPWERFRGKRSGELRCCACDNFRRRRTNTRQRADASPTAAAAAAAGGAGYAARSRPVATTNIITSAPRPAKRARAASREGGGTAADASTTAPLAAAYSVGSAAPSTASACSDTQQPLSIPSNGPDPCWPSSRREGPG